MKIKENILRHSRTLLLALATFAAMVLPEAAPAQVVTSLPAYVDNNGGVTDFGNGPLEFKVLSGNGTIFTSTGSGVGSGTTTSITLTATPAVPPCIGCAISGGTLIASSIVTAYNGTTGITTNTSQTVAASTPLSWGAACPSTAAGVKGVFLQPGQPPGGDMPFYTLGRICGYAGNGPGLAVMPFAIGAH